jgi:hypothetical protein
VSRRCFVRLAFAAVGRTVQRESSLVQDAGDVGSRMASRLISTTQEQKTACKLDGEPRTARETRVLSATFDAQPSFDGREPYTPTLCQTYCLASDDVKYNL